MVMLKNAYVVYGSINKYEGIYRSKRKFQYEFRISIALDWINPDAVNKKKMNTTSNKRI